LCRERGAARAAGRDQPADIAAPNEEVLEGHRHRAHRGAAVVGENGALALGMVPRHFARMDHRRRRLARGGEVDRHRAKPELVQAVAKVEELAPLGVEGAADVRGALGALGDRELDHPSFVYGFPEIGL
jgi:hypothetical protein